MSRVVLLALSCLGIVLLVNPPAVRAQSFAAVGNLDCNGFSKIQSPLKPTMACADFFNSDEGYRGYDNGHYIGHDEPSIEFVSTAPHSGSSLQYDITLPVERPLPATQSFENYATFWFSMAICDPNSFPNGACLAASDENTPNQAGSALLELQLYPPGFPPFITQISCDLEHWCAALNIDSLEVINTGANAGSLNPNCPEPVNFAFLQRNGVPAGPPGPATATNATFTPNKQTLLMNQGDHLRITIEETPAGLLTRIDDLTTGQSGFMVASGANGFQNTDPNSCAGANFDFHPEFDTAKFGNFVPWAALQANIDFAYEIGHFQVGPNGDNDPDDAPCFPGPTVAGCTGANTDFDGTSYLFDWPDGSPNKVQSAQLRSVHGGGIGPLSLSDKTGDFTQPYPIIFFETEVGASEPTCMPNGVGCTVPPAGAKFYPFHALAGSSYAPGSCALLFGNFNGFGIDNFGRDKQYGAPNLPWFFGNSSGGPQANPCIPQTDE
jgi:hypothetical protein